MRFTDSELRYVQALEAEHAAVYEFLKISGQWCEDEAKAHQVLTFAEEIVPGKQAEIARIGAALIAVYIAVGDASLAVKAESRQAPGGSLQA